LTDPKLPNRSYANSFSSPATREDVILAFGTVAYWQAEIARLTAREPHETDPTRKRYTRLLLLNAQTQLQVANEGEAK